MKWEEWTAAIKFTLIFQMVILLEVRCLHNLCHMLCDERHLERLTSENVFKYNSCYLLLCIKWFKWSLITAKIEQFLIWDCPWTIHIHIIYVLGKDTQGIWVTEKRAHRFWATNGFLTQCITSLLVWLVLLLFCCWCCCKKQYKWVAHKWLL